MRLTQEPDLTDDVAQIARPLGDGYALPAVCDPAAAAIPRRRDPTAKTSVSDPPISPVAVAPIPVGQSEGAAVGIAAATVSVTGRGGRKASECGEAEKGERTQAQASKIAHPVLPHWPHQPPQPRRDGLFYRLPLVMIKRCSMRVPIDRCFPHSRTRQSYCVRERRAAAYLSPLAGRGVVTLAPGDIRPIHEREIAHARAVG